MSHQHGPDGGAVAVPNTQQFGNAQISEGTLVHDGEGKLHVYTNGRWKPFVPSQPQVAEPQPPEPEPEEDDWVPKPEKWRFRGF
jgi:hypothetical protein